VTSTGARHHVAVRPPAAVAAPLQRWRVRFDPVMAARAPAHVTVVYPEELPDPALQVARAAAVARPPFRLALGAVRRSGGWVGVAVEDVDGGWAGLRAELLAPPFGPLDVGPPHLTIVHPRTSDAAEAAWHALRDARPGGAFAVDELLVTATDDTGCAVLGRTPLHG
jgi:hypothetical protein